MLVKELIRRLASQGGRIPNRAHYRIVFEEAGQAAHFLQSLPDAYKTLHDAVESVCSNAAAPFLADIFIGQGLRLMHMHHYVHRDVSSGNIIFYSGHGRIADLEYAKKIGTGAGENDRTVRPSSRHTDACLIYLDAWGNNFRDLFY